MQAESLGKHITPLGNRKVGQRSLMHRQLAKIIRRLMV